MSGNVITDVGVGGPDTVAPGAAISSVNGTAVVGATVIDGDYGTLTVNPDGSYTYTVDPTFAGSYGDQDVFTYTWTAPGGVTETADLVVTLDYNGPAAGFAVFGSKFSLLEEPGLTLELEDEPAASAPWDGSDAATPEGPTTADIAELEPFQMDPLFGPDALGKVEEQPI